MSTASQKPDRNAALDFTKGALVLFMVLYHWINYFVSTDGYFYRYLRFITPSFIFLTGFLIANVYLARYQAADFRLHKRLLERGAKLLALFTVLNLGIRLVLTKNYEGSSSGAGRNLSAAYLTGGGGAAFEVLVPISYLLLLSALLLWLRRWYQHAFAAACVAAFAGVLVLDLYGVKVPNLELIAIGLLGVLFGHASPATLGRMAAYAPAIVVAYIGYLAAISVWNVLYVLQVVGVCLSLMLIYLLGTRTSGRGFIQSRVLTLGRYSLVSYIAQIMILQVLRRVFPPDHGPATLVLSLAAVLVLCQITVELIEWGKEEWKPLDRLYRFVFS